MSTDDSVRTLCDDLRRHADFLTGTNQHGTCTWVAPRLTEAADTIESLQAEVERLRGVEEAAIKAISIWRGTARLSKGYILDIERAIYGRS